MTVQVNKNKNGAGNEWSRILLDHTGSTVTINEDEGGFIDTADHDGTGLLTLNWKASVVGANAPGISGITCASNLVGHLVSPTAASSQINTKLNNSGANFTAGRIELYVRREG